MKPPPKNGGSFYPSFNSCYSCYSIYRVYSFYESRFLIVEDLSDLTGTDCATTLTDSEAQTDVQSHSVDELYSDLYVLPSSGHR